MIRQIVNLSKPFFKQSKAYAIGMGLVIILISLSTVYLSFLFNEWRGRFYDALQAMQVGVFWHEMIVFSVLAAFAIIAYTLQAYFTQRYALVWRIETSRHYLRKWVQRGDRGALENSDQRIQEDLRGYTKQVATLFVGTADALAMILVFTPVLLQLSATTPVFGHIIPGSLWVISFIFAVGGSAACFWIGRKVPGLEYLNQRVEANFRYNLVEIRQTDEIYQDIPASLDKHVEEVYINYKAMFHQFKLFGFASNAYFQIAIIVPFTIMGSGFFTGAITLGVLMQVANAFDRMNSAMTYLLDRYLDIAELQSVVVRLTEFEETLK